MKNGMLEMDRGLRKGAELNSGRGDGDGDGDRRLRNGLSLA